MEEYSPTLIKEKEFTDYTSKNIIILEMFIRDLERYTKIMVKCIRILWIAVLVVIFLLCSCACNSDADTANITSNNIDTQKVTSEKAEEDEVIIVYKDVGLEGFWHDAPDFSKGMGSSYQFFNDDLFDFDNGNGSRDSGSWDIKENNVLELTIEKDEGKASVYSYNIEFIDKDSATGYSVLIIDNQKFWKMIKPLDIINGSPLYINHDYNLRLEDYQDKKAVTMENYDDNNQENIIVYCGRDLYDLRISKISSDDGINFNFENVVYYFGKLSSDSFLEYTTYIPEGMPCEAISFADENGVVYSYILHYNGRDGSTCAWKSEVIEKSDMTE